MIVCYVLAVIAMCLFLISLGGACLKRALLDKVRQDLYRARARVFDRVISGELKLEEERVSQFIEYTHAVVHLLENVSYVDVLVAWLEAGSPRAPILWLDDERLKEEVDMVISSTCWGVFYTSSLVFSLVLFVRIVLGMQPFFDLARRLTLWLANLSRMNWTSTVAPA